MTGPPITRVYESVEDPDPSGPGLTHGQPVPIAAAPKAAGRGPGAPVGNQNATKTGKRSKIGHAGSKLGEQLGGAEDHVNDDVNRVLSELRELHPDWVQPDGSLRLSASTDACVMRLRRAYERDRVAAKLLKDRKDLKGNDLTLAQQNELRESQDEALSRVEDCLDALGLTANGSPGSTRANSNDPHGYDALWDEADRIYEADEAKRLAEEADEDQEPDQDAEEDGPEE